MLDRALLTQTGRAVASVQEANGAIPWTRDMHLDPWDHVEAAMGLDVAGLHREAERAYTWLAVTQARDGSWPAASKRGLVVDPTLDANFCAYVATGVWHHFLATGDDVFVRRMWPVVEKAIDFVLELQLPGGAIAWARDGEYRVWPGALITSSSSIHMSLWCAITLAERVGNDRPDWELSVANLAQAIRRVDGDFEDKARYAMDWYYPVLGGVLRGPQGAAHIGARWDEFVVPHRGVLCTSDKPWVTTGETCEAIMALCTIGSDGPAAELFEWIQHLRDADGLYWTGANHPDTAIWPREKTTWSAGAVLLAHDALAGGVTQDLFVGTALAPLPAFDDSLSDLI